MTDSELMSCSVANQEGLGIVWMTTFSKVYFVLYDREHQIFARDESWNIFIVGGNWIKTFWRREKLAVLAATRRGAKAVIVSPTCRHFRKSLLSNLREESGDYAKTAPGNVMEIIQQIQSKIPYAFKSSIVWLGHDESMEVSRTARAVWQAEPFSGKSRRRWYTKTTTNREARASAVKHSKPIRSSRALL